MNKSAVISKKSVAGDLVVVSRREYEDFSLWKKAIKINLGEKWFWTEEWQKKEAEADKALRAGKIVGPFADHKKLLLALKGKRR